MLPFEQELLPFPGDGERYCYINAMAPEGRDWQSVLDCEQGDRRSFLQLEAAGFSVEPSRELENYDGALVLAGKHKRLNEANVIRAWNGLKPGKILVVAGDKNVGIAPLRKFVQAKVEVEESLSKNHGLVFWVVKQATDWELSPVGAAVEGYKTAPGMFSPEKIDMGSSLLAEHFDERIRGSVADFGAGWGYLCGELLSCSKKLSHLDLYEADWASLEAAKENISDKVGDVHMGAYWIDITAEPITRKYNWIIMNPPFHAGRKADIPLGESFIAKARQSLQPKGKLLMVANIQLPYEALLKQKFSRCELLSSKGGFKVFEAMV
ncbi:MAG: methyltransferase [Hyphomicrobiales bacterium]|nr:MAG: methyltransferase [Hyphomicrobiales bacterium]